MGQTFGLLDPDLKTDHIASNRDELQNQIIAECNLIRNAPVVFERVRKSF